MGIFTMIGVIVVAVVVASYFGIQLLRCTLGQGDLERELK